MTRRVPADRSVGQTMIERLMFFSLSPVFRSAVARRRAAAPPCQRLLAKRAHARARPCHHCLPGTMTQPAHSLQIAAILSPFVVLPLAGWLGGRGSRAASLLSAIPALLT